MHPSWRDLVIDELAGDAQERRRFLKQCGVDGAAVALGGERRLLRTDADWDALGDGLYQLCADIDEAEAVRLLDVIADAGEDDEVKALAELVLKRLGWSGKAVSVEAIGAWAAVSKWLDPRPDPPAVALTWLALEPSHPPRTPVELERMADWLRLAELLRERAPELLEGLGFPDRYHDLLLAFADSTPADEPVLERELRIESLARLAWLDPVCEARAATESIALSFEVAPPAPRRRSRPGSRSSACSETFSELLHALDLDRLIGVHVQDELADLALRAAALVHQLLHHRQRAPVVLGHVAQVELVELAALGVLEPARVGAS